MPKELFGPKAEKLLAMHLREHMRSGPYQAYTYAYPHKTAYRELPQPLELCELWSAEPRDALFAYIHVPFCTYRCGFCNLFALGRPAADLVEGYVQQLQRQIRIVSATLCRHRFARFALGGGTPSYLTPHQLAQVFDAVATHLDIDLHAIPAGIEVSPETATAERLRVCRAAGCDRVSMGIQSFIASELQALVRPHQPQAVVRAIEAIRELEFATLNLDLIYGIAGQTAASLTQSVRSALAFEPEELYLYPLYVRPGTGLGRIQQDPLHAQETDRRMELYRIARDLLLEAGYQQVSMRMFRSPRAPETCAPVYCCQNDGMVGFGCGARSYTRQVHYSDRYGVERGPVSQILKSYVEAEAQSFAWARYGFTLDAHEQRRRFIIQSLLVWPGLIENAYTARFCSNVFTDVPQLTELLELDLAERSVGLLKLTPTGMAHADTIGPWLASAPVVERMRTYASTR